MEINTSPMKITVKRNRKPTKQSEKASKSPSKPAVESYTADAIKTAIDESIADEKIKIAFGFGSLGDWMEEPFSL
jgi:hypothetical protein